MKKTIAFLSFLLIMPVVFANIDEWPQFGYNSQNWNGRASSAYYGDLNLTSYTGAYGSYYQPLVYNLDNSGEIDIFVQSTDRLLIYDNDLDILAQLNNSFGITGQPALTTRSNLSGDQKASIIVHNNSHIMYIEFNGSSLNLIDSTNTNKQLSNQGFGCYDDGSDYEYCIIKYGNATSQGGFVTVNIPYDASFSDIVYNYTDRGELNSTIVTIPQFNDIDGSDGVDFVMWSDLPDGTDQWSVYNLASKNRIFNGTAINRVTDSYGTYNPLIYNFDGGNGEIWYVGSWVGAGRKEYMYCYNTTNIACTGYPSASCVVGEFSFPKYKTDRSNIVLAKLNGNTFICSFCYTDVSGGGARLMNTGIACYDENGMNADASFIESELWQTSCDYCQYWMGHNRLSVGDFNDDNNEDFLLTGSTSNGHNGKIVDTWNDNRSLVSFGQKSFTSALPIDLDNDTFLDVLAMKSDNAYTYLSNPNVEYCNGTIEVYVENNFEVELNSYNVYLNDILQGNTNNYSQKILNLNNVGCDFDQEIKVTCNDISKVCGIDTTEIDMNGDTDYLSFDCSICSSTNDLYISQDDIYVDVSSDEIKATVHSRGITSNVVVVIYIEGNDGIIREVAADTIWITENSEENATFNVDVGSTDYLHIYVDSDNAIEEEDNSNNYIFRAAVKPIDAYIDVDVDSSFSVLNDLIREYIGSFVNEVPTANESDVIIIVGHPFNSLIEEDNDGIHQFFGKDSMTKPYAGIVKYYSYFDNPYESFKKPQIIVYGNRIEGTIAAVKRMINARNIFLNKDLNSYVSYIDDYDTLGISIMDQLHNSETKTHFTSNDSYFKEIVRKVLFDNNFEVSVRPVKTLDTTSYGESTLLRVKHVNSDFSEDYKDAVGISDKPVVLARGLWSNLFTWEDFGKELSQNGSDVWLIEITGGPYQDCETCPNYNYSDLVDYYWPALIAGVSEYSGKNQIDYVGFSNGCRVALSSLEDYSSSGKNNAGYYFDYDTGTYVYSDLPSEPVDTFVGVGCPGAFNGTSRYITKSIEKGDNAIYKHSQKGMFHLTMKDHAKKTDWLLSLVFPDENKISLNLLDFYNNIAINTTDSQPANNLTINQVYFVVGNYSNRYIESGINNDFIVPIRDVFQMNISINSQNNGIVIIRLRHDQLPDDVIAKEYVKSRLR